MARGGDDVSPMKKENSNSKRHWQVLRRALVSQAKSTNAELSATISTASSIATEFFPVFLAEPTHPELLVTAPTAAFAWLTYNLSLPKPQRKDACRAVMVHVHEKRKDKKISIAELFSHKVNQGVDNTGNIRTWPSEAILLSYLLQHEVCQSVQRRDANGIPIPINCCELGGGMAGLASLGLLAHYPVEINRFFITDGNPLAVQNLKLCVEANLSLGIFPSAILADGGSGEDNKTSVTVELLRWDRHMSASEELRNRFDLIFASDCLFFEDFHVGLAHTIKQFLRPRTGRCLLLQPSRNGSMERFIQIAQAHGFMVHRSDDYDPEITQKHLQYQQTRPDYVPDVHFPIFLTLSLP